MVGQGAELLDGSKHVDELGHALAKEIKLAENVALVEVKLLHLGLCRELVLGNSVLADIFKSQRSPYIYLAKALQKVLLRMYACS